MEQRKGGRISTLRQDVTTNEWISYFVWAVAGAMFAVAWLLSLRAAQTYSQRKLPRVVAATAYVLSPPALAALKAELLPEADATVKLAALDALGRIKDGKAAALLSRFTGDADPEVRRQAVEAMAHLETPAALRPLAAALADAEESVRCAAAAGLARMPDKRLVPFLLRAVEDSSELRWLQTMLPEEERAPARGIAGALADLVARLNAAERQGNVALAEELRQEIAQAVAVERQPRTEEATGERPSLLPDTTHCPSELKATEKIPK